MSSQELLEACQKGYLDKVLQLLSTKKIDINCKNI